MITLHTPSAVLPCGEVRWETKIAGAGTLTALLPAETAPEPGLSLRLQQDGETIFDGFVFTSERQRDRCLVTACDRLRYLLYRDTKVFSGKTAGEIVREICGERGLPLGRVRDTGPRLPSLIADNRPLLDIIRTALEQTRILSGERLCFYDSGGVLQLLPESELGLSQPLTGSTLISAYAFQEDIGSDTFNRIQLVRKNRRTGRREVFVREDRASMARWGVLQYCAQVTQNTTDGEIAAMMDSLLKQKNRPVRGMTLQCAGDFRFRAGVTAPVSLGEGQFSGRCRVLEAVHRLEGGGHTMKLKLEECDAD